MFALRFEMADDIPSVYFSGHRIIKGVVVHVTDGDTIRVRHINSICRTSTFVGRLSDHTISVRLAAIDCPEKGQPYSTDAKMFTSRLIGKIVHIKLLSRDQYRRVVGTVTYDSGGICGCMSHKMDWSEEIMKEGLAVVYRQSGAQYGENKNLEYWMGIEDNVKMEKKGMWAEEEVELPSVYKKRMKTL